MILETMLQRLYSDLVHGPCLNCRPHSSRQRADLSLFSRLKNIEPSRILHSLLASEKRIEIETKASPFISLTLAEGLSEEQKRHKTAWDDHQKFFTRLKDISHDAAEYEQDTGETALSIGFPLLCLPPMDKPGAAGGVTSRIIAPVAFIPVSLAIQRKQNPSIFIQSRGAGSDLVIPNAALLAWIEQQTGVDTSNLFADEEGAEPYRELNEIVRFVCEALKLPPPPQFTPESLLVPAPKTEELPKKPTLVWAAAIGLFPVANQGLLRDTRAMMDGKSLEGPIRAFLQTDILTKREEAPPAPEAPPPPSNPAGRAAEERLIAPADPCQNQAVKMARKCPALVIHGPPGTGKSQTITNIIGDHLSRGERVLVVCDKRTALDVVKFRLDHAGLGRFCAVVHDPQRDQRLLYKTIREQLEGLAEEPEAPSRETGLKRANKRLETLYEELAACHISLQSKGTLGLSFHEMVGHWFALENSPELDLSGFDAAEIKLEELLPLRGPLQEVFQKVLKTRYPQNPWSQAAGLPLGQFLTLPIADIRARLDRLAPLARAADEKTTPGLPGFAEDAPLAEQGALRGRLAAQLKQLVEAAPPALLARWSQAEPAALQKARGQIDQVKASLAVFEAKPLDPELALLTLGKPPALAELNQKIGALREYQPHAAQWYRFFLFGKRGAANAAVSPFGLKPDAASVNQALEFLEGLKARLILSEANRVLSQAENAEALCPDAALEQSFRGHQLLLDLFQSLDQTPQLQPFLPLIRSLLKNPDSAAGLIGALVESEERARRLESLEKGLEGCGLFNAGWLCRTKAELRGGGLFSETSGRLVEMLPTLEDCIRLREALLNLPKSLAPSAEFLLNKSVEAEAAWEVLLKAAYHNELSGRIRSDAALQKIDPERLDAVFEEIFDLEKEKRALVTGQILHLWQSKQRHRLLAGTGTQLNSLGTRLKQRLFLRGERALKLRQMIALGREIPDGDPLFDVCPVWMASPATVAQIFPREAVFDAVIFDEASQARLEESLPVLTRGKRVIIAGDPKQLPPTRFFESGVAESEAASPENEQDLFEQQQSEVEDLLTAALNIEIQQSYLDVHYRSQDSGLIEFSNQEFYADRLQALPGHPDNPRTESPIRFYRVDGLYANRQNQKEAEQALAIVEKLLAQPDPPSIGIACFNLQQRDLITAALDARAEKNSVFGERLGAARERQGAGSFEGLFVKNLENVQGDERDHIIISTTFGLDADGKFRRNFGPLGRAAGGRRLNVLITRARQAVHLVTSIPRSEYISLPPVAHDQLPNGRYYLYAYLKYSDLLASNHSASEAAAGTPENSPGRASADPMLASLAKHLERGGQMGSVAEWGNEGFCVDLALHPQGKPEAIWGGLLCDTSRYAKFSDPIEWDLFKTRILREQGWKLQRVWSPNFFRNPDAATEGIRKRMGQEPSGT